MRKILLTLVLGLVMVTSAYATQEHVDQQYLNYDNSVSINYGDMANTERRPAQGFILSGDQTVTAVEVMRGGIAGSPTGNWTLRIETDNSSKPSGTLANINASIVVTPPSSNGVVAKGSFATPFVLNASTTYWLVAQCDNQTTNNAWYLSSSATEPGYPYGAAGTIVDGVWYVQGIDMYFKIYVVGSSSQSQFWY